MIEEIPVEAAVEAEPELAAPVQPESAPAPKRRGRPPGSLNKKTKIKNAAPAEEAPATPPRARAGSSKVAPARMGSAAAALPSPDEAKPPKKRSKRRPPSPSSSEEEERPRRRRRAAGAGSSEQAQVYEPPDSRQIAAEVLSMLSSRHLDLRQAKREKYRGWFQQ